VVHSALLLPEKRRCAELQRQWEDIASRTINDNHAPLDRSGAGRNIVGAETTGSAQSGTSGQVQGSLDTNNISNATLSRLADQAGGDLGKLLDSIREQNQR
jgi:hypothetical protein